MKVYGGGGGTIVRSEIAELEAYGVEKIFSPEDGQRLGLAGMINTMIATCDVDPAAAGAPPLEDVFGGDQRALARLITVLEAGALPGGQAGGAAAGGGREDRARPRHHRHRRIGEVVADRRAAAAAAARPGGQAPHRVIAVDPTRRKGGGALLGDRIRMNTLDSGQVYFRSLATRGAKELPEALDDIIAAAKAAGFDLVIVETPGIGQGDAAIVPHVDVPIYVMTPEFGAASQLEKIDMLDFAEAVVINKFDRRGADDALRDVRRQLVRNREAFSAKPDEMPVFGTVASRFHDDGVTALYQHLRGLLAEKGLRLPTEGALAPVETRISSAVSPIVPPERSRYLAEIAADLRTYHERTAAAVAAARRCTALETARELLAKRDGVADSTTADLDAALERRGGSLEPGDRKLLEGWPADGGAVLGRRAGREGPRSGAADDPHPGVAVGLARSPASPCPATRTPASCSASCGPRTCRAISRSPPACSPSSGKGKTRPACSPARVTPSGPTAASTTWPRATWPPACRPPSTRSPSTASTPTSGPTSTARSERRACRSPPSTT